MSWMTAIKYLLILSDLSFGHWPTHHNVLHNNNKATFQECVASLFAKCVSLKPQIVAKLRPLCERCIWWHSRCVRLRAAWHCCLTLSGQRRQCCESSPRCYFSVFLFFLLWPAPMSSMSSLMSPSLMALLIGEVSLKWETFNGTTCQALLLWLGSEQVRKGEKILGARLKHLTFNFFLFF